MLFDKPWALERSKGACPNFRAGVTVDIHRVWWGRHSCLPESASAGHSRPAERIRIGSGGQECPPLTDSRQTGMSAPPFANSLPENRARPSKGRAWQIRRYLSFPPPGVAGEGELLLKIR